MLRQRELTAVALPGARGVGGTTTGGGKAITSRSAGGVTKTVGNCDGWTKGLRMDFEKCRFDVTAMSGCAAPVADGSLIADGSSTLGADCWLTSALWSCGKPVAS
jgi:hypothetical protein